MNFDHLFLYLVFLQLIEYTLIEIFKGNRMNDVVITFSVLAALILLFFVIIASLNKSVDYLSRVVFLLKTEFEYRAEEQEVRMVLSAMEDEEL